MLKVADALAAAAPAAGPTTIRRAAPGLDWNELNQALELIRHKGSDAASRKAAALALVSKHLSAAYATWVQLTPQGEWQFEPQCCAVAEKAGEHRENVLAAMTKFVNSAESVRGDVDRERKVVLGRFGAGGNTPWLAAVVDPAANLSLASAVVRWIGLETLAETQAAPAENQGDEKRMSAAVLGLTVRLAAASDCTSGAKLLAEILCQHLGAERVGVAFLQRKRMKVKLAALSHVDRLDQQGEAVALIEECLKSSLPLANLVSWTRTGDGGPLDGPPAAQRLAEQWKASTITALRLADRNGEAVAVCLIASRQAASPQLECFLTLVGQVAGPLLNVLQRGTVRKWLADVRSSIPAWATAWWTLCAVAILGTAVMWPYPMQIKCPVVLEPLANRLVVAPFEGVFDHSEVRPGDRVEAGKLLGRMDGRELRMRLAGLEADITRSGKSRDANLVAGKLAEAQIDKLQRQRLLQERSVIEQRLKQLEICSPIAGIVVSGDLTRQQGATVRVGQALFEVAPLDRLTAEIAVPEEDLEFVASDAAVSVRLDAVAGRALTGTIERIHPRAEPRDNKQVFIAETSFASSGELRPGMKGAAKITGPKSPLLWQWIRKPVNTVRRFLGW